MDAKNWIVYDEYVDGGFSGAKTNRPALQKLIKDIEKKNNIDMVLVYKPDRLSRSQKDTLYLIEDVFNANHVHFSSMLENFDTSTPLGMAMVGILSVFAQLERSQIQERMQLGRDARAKSGLYHGGGHTPIGYIYDPATKQLVIDEYEAMQVRKVFQLFIEDNSIQTIKNIMHKSYTNRYGNYTCSKTIRSILTCPAYPGMIRHGDKVYQGSHELIIDKDTFDKVQKLYKKHCETW